MVKHYKPTDLLRTLNEIKTLNKSTTEIMYLEMNQDTVNDILLSPELDQYIGGRGLLDTKTLEHWLNCKIFIHKGERDIVTITHRTNLLLDMKDE